MPRIALLALASTLAVSLVATAQDYPDIPPGQARSEKALGAGKMRYWPEHDDQAKVLTATFLGGAGTEWLVDGGFQPDGTVVVAGNVMGPVFTVPGRTVRVLGQDAPPPGPVALPKDKKGEVEKPSWRQPGVTGFVARLSPDLKTVLDVTRLPWQAGAITAAEVGPDGSIYVAGKATDAITRLGGPLAEVPVPPDATAKGAGACDYTFVAKLAPNAGRCEWVRTTRGPANAPQLKLLQDGSVKFGAQDLKTFDPAGKLLASVAVPGGVRETTSVSPVDGTIVRGGEHHSPTGREPWRCPTLFTYKPDGTLQYQFYDWGGRYVGLDNCRQVSDSAVRFVTHDRAGNILLSAWSDGGNSVMVSQPYDVRRGVGHRGLGLSTAGAGVLSVVYLIKLDPKTFTCTGWTLWLPFYNGKPNSVWLESLALADDGSICFGARSAWGIIQTRNKLANGEPSGPHIVVLSPDMSRCRFSSTVPGAGAAEVGNDRDGWGVATGSVGGSPRVMFLSGAASAGTQYDLTTPTPVKDAAQGTFGGGLSDGYLVVLDLSVPPPPTPTPGTPTAGTPPASPSPTATPAPPARLTIAREASSKSSKNQPTESADGTVYSFSPTFPKWVTVDAEIRDARGAYWPNFMVGKPVSGTLTAGANGPVVKNVVVECPEICQPKGDQGRRVLGGLFAGEQGPKLTFTLTSLGAPKTEEIEETDKSGKPVTRTYTYCEGQGTLALGGKTLAVTPKVSVRYGNVVEKSIPRATVNAYFTVKGSALGLTGPLASEDIDIRIGMQGVVAPAPRR